MYYLRPGLMLGLRLSPLLSIVRAPSIALLSAPAAHSTLQSLLGMSVLDVRTDTIFKITGNAILDAEMECFLAGLRAVDDDNSDDRDGCPSFCEV